MEDLKFVTSERGQPKLVEGGFVYLRERTVDTVTYWKCEQHKKKRCRARLHTESGKVIHRWKDEHISHVGDACIVERAELKT
jgi:hypothetical protein